MLWEHEVWVRFPVARKICFVNISFCQARTILKADIENIGKAKMPLPDLGKTAGILGGGGAAQGLPEIIQINEFLDAGIKFDYLNGTSVGALAVLNLRQAYQIYRDDIHSKADIWDYDPDIKAAAKSILQNTPHEPFRHPIKFFKFIFYAFSNIPPIPWGSDPFNEFARLEPFADKLSALAKMYGLKKDQHFVDLSPLIKKIRERLDLSEFWKQNTKVHIFARSIENGDIYVFTNKEEDCGKNTRFIYMNSESEAFKAAEAACAIRDIIPPVNINGHYYCDAGTANPFPIDYAFDAVCDTIFAFVKDFERYARGNDILERKLEDDNAAMKGYTSAIKKLADIRMRQEKQKLYIIHPQYPLHPDLSLLGLSRAAKEHTFPTEREATRKWLKENLNIEY